ncbi:MAG: hypothetical protein P1V97_11870 [Planctomycetota bacterium]|nr:hypothetical protein [Planctomycetota bacterium]
MTKLRECYPAIFFSVVLTLIFLSGTSTALAQGRRGLTPISRSQFRLHNENKWSESATLNSALSTHCKIVSLQGVLGNLTHKAQALSGNSKPLPAAKIAFRWDAADDKDSRWFPQGVTGSGDASQSGLVANRQLIAVSWHFNELLAFGAADQGARVSFIDITKPGIPRYQHVLFVESFKDKLGPNFRALKFHAGGMVWYGDYLYVADATVGLRVFDLTKIMQVDPGKTHEIGRNGKGQYHAHDHVYILPQVNCYRLHSKSSKLRFSSLSLDRSTKPPSLISGDYKVLSRRGKLLRWGLNNKSHRLEGKADIKPIEAYEMGQSRVQGVLSWKGQFWMASSGLRPRLRTGRPRSKIHARPWVLGPEDLYFDCGSSLLWTATEFPRRRYILAVPLPGLEERKSVKPGR